LGAIDRGEEGRGQRGDKQNGRGEAEESADFHGKVLPGIGGRGSIVCIQVLEIKSAGPRAVGAGLPCGADQSLDENPYFG
jgi:hypothetical protein